MIRTEPSTSTTQIQQQSRASLVSEYIGALKQADKKTRELALQILASQNPQQEKGDVAGDERREALQNQFYQTLEVEIMKDPAITSSVLCELAEFLKCRAVPVMNILAELEFCSDGEKLEKQEFAQRAMEFLKAKFPKASFAFDAQELSKWIEPFSKAFNNIQNKAIMFRVDQLHKKIKSGYNEEIHSEKSVLDLFGDNLRGCL